MSFWSSLILVRSAPPPVVTTTALAAFLRALLKTEALVTDPLLLCEIKYGPRVDADDRGTDAIEWDESHIIATIGEYAWDQTDHFPTLAAMADALEADSGLFIGPI